MPVLFALTMFVSATLLFLVQPMVGKMTLPLLGGTPAVWNTCMVFFQALLLLGYLYAHKLSGGDRPFGEQTTTHYLVLLLALVSMAAGSIFSERNTPIPIYKSLAPKGDEIPFFNVILVLSLAVALPFLVLSTSAPLLQKWFTLTGHPSARDPYFLYGASNFGSLLSLVGYPFVIEPNFTVLQQTYIWAIGYLILACMIAACGNSVKKAMAQKEELAKYASKAKSQTAKKTLIHQVDQSKNGGGTKTQAAVTLVETEEAGKGVGPGQRDEVSKYLEKLKAKADDENAAPTMARRLRWLGLAFVPSSLMCSVTTFISTDIASLPLLWVIPLALYLITFIIAFSRIPAIFNLIITLFAPVLVLLLFFIMNSNTTIGSFLGRIVLHLAVFFVVTLCCHCELAKLRPKNTRYLTNFYLTMSLGGMLGGLFNALIAPLVFQLISEYPLTLVLACLLFPKLDEAKKDGISSYDIILPVAVFGATLMAFQFFYRTSFERPFREFFLVERDAGYKSYAEMARSILFYGLPIMVCYFFVERPFRFALSVMGVWLAFTVYEYRSENRNLDEQGLPRTVVHRGFFGVLKIEADPMFNRLVHGTTLHGKQFRSQEEWVAGMASLSLGGGTTLVSNLNTAALLVGLSPEWEPAELRPLTYYHRTGPVGFIVQALRERSKVNPNTNTDTACIGMGTGSLTAYGLPGQNMTIFEIDPVVARLVEPGLYFTYIKKARERGVNIEVQMGDARLTLERLTDRKFSLMFVDAFSSDAIPVHLLTKQAMELYFSRLHEDGLLAVHISNRYLELEPVVKNLAASLGVACRIMHDGENAPGKTASSWILLTRKLEYMGPTILDPRDWDGDPVWDDLKDKGKKVGVWTDDFAPVIPILKMPMSLFSRE